jgi:hypothetical protein
MWGGPNENYMITTTPLSFSLSLSIQILCWCVVERMLFHKEDANLDHTWHKKVEMRRKTARTFFLSFFVFPSPCILLCIIHSCQSFLEQKNYRSFLSQLCFASVFWGHSRERVWVKSMISHKNQNCILKHPTQPTWKGGTRLLFQ